MKYLIFYIITYVLSVIAYDKIEDTQVRKKIFKYSILVIMIVDLILLAVIKKHFLDIPLILIMYGVMALALLTILENEKITVYNAGIIPKTKEESNEVVLTEYVEKLHDVLENLDVAHVIYENKKGYDITIFSFCPAEKKIIQDVLGAEYDSYTQIEIEK